jgi:hypothetical protein
MNSSKILNWLAFLAFGLAFATNVNWISIPSIAPNTIWIMIGASLVSFLFANSVKWLGMAIVVFGLALSQGWINLNLSGISLHPSWLMLSGFLIMFFNSK